ncbi:MAG: glycosyl transferase family protein [Sphingomonas sp.]|nr:glycosyl transferase family protein [Sphingomonas sp.]
MAESRAICAISRGCATRLATRSGGIVSIVAGIVTGLDSVAREAMLFAGVGFLIGGLDDLAVDLVYFARRGWRWNRDADRIAVAPDVTTGPIAIFVPAWDEASVIGAMLATALDRLDHPDYRLYVGTYPNDRATIEAVATVAERDARVRLVVGSRPGPTTKADCLNTLWHALRRDEADGVRARAIVLHDAEDVVHPAELRVFEALIGDHAAVQLPVRPLVDPAARLISGHYADEFAEAHAKQLVVRAALGAALPLAGVGCAIERSMLDAIAAARGGDPFDAASLTEDYELGLAIAARGGRGVLARVRDDDGKIVAVRAYFPARLADAVRQKARWMTGIALAGWDRVGWGRLFDLSDHWMRMRDRRAPLAVLVLGAAYLAVVAWGLAVLLHWTSGSAPPALVPGWLLVINSVLLGWRLVMRMAFTGAIYGWREALWSLPRAFVGNVIALLAARRALLRYVAMLRGGPLVWDKTTHAFPDLSGEARR